jgi:hypothetical protein
MITPDDVFADPLEGMDLRVLYEDPRYFIWHSRRSIRDELRILKDWTYAVKAIDPRQLSHDRGGSSLVGKLRA